MTMQDFYQMVPIFLPSWFVALLALLAAGACIGLSLYLMHTRDHLILHAADLGAIGVFSALVAFHYILISVSNNYDRGVAMSRISWSLFFSANVVIMGRYILAIARRKLIPA